MTARAISASASAAVPRGSKFQRRKQQRLEHELRERQRDIEERASRSCAPRDDDAPLPRID